MKEKHAGRPPKKTTDPTLDAGQVLGAAEAAEEETVADAGGRREPKGFVYVAESLGKIAAVGATTAYITGFAVTAKWLSSFGVPTVELLNAQYVVAGALPASVILLTAYVCHEGWIYSTRLRSDKTRGKVWFRVFLATLALFFVVVALEAISQSNDGDPTSAVAWQSAEQIAKVVFAQFMIWLMIAGLRSGILKEDRLKQVSFVLVGCLFCFVVFWHLPRWFSQVHEWLPQAYGGGRLLEVRLCVDPKRTPVELLPDGVAESTARITTKPVLLVFRSSSEYLLKSTDEHDPRTWTMRSNAVYAVLVDPDAQPKKQNEKRNKKEK